MRKSLVVFSVLLIAVFADDFDISQFEGKWYEIYRSPDFPFTKGTDTTVACYGFKEDTDKGMSCYLNEWNVDEEKWDTDVGRGTIDPSDPRLFSFFFMKHAEAYDTVLIRVIYTDFKNVAAMLINTGSGIYAWIWARQPQASPNVQYSYQKALEQLAPLGLSVKLLVQTRHGVAREKTTTVAPTEEPQTTSFPDWAWPVDTTEPAFIPQVTEEPVITETSTEATSPPLTTTFPKVQPTRPAFDPFHLPWLSVPLIVRQETPQPPTAPADHVLTLMPTKPVTVQQPVELPATAGPFVPNRPTLPPPLQPSRQVPDFFRPAFPSFLLTQPAPAPFFTTTFAPPETPVFAPQPQQAPRQDNFGFFGMPSPWMLPNQGGGLMGPQQFGFMQSGPKLAFSNDWMFGGGPSYANNYQQPAVRQPPPPPPPTTTTVPPPPVHQQQQPVRRRPQNQWFQMPGSSLFEMGKRMMSPYNIFGGAQQQPQPQPHPSPPQRQPQPQPQQQPNQQKWFWWPW